MNIQYIGFNPHAMNGDKKITCSNLNSPKDFDDFDLNFIDLNSIQIWGNFTIYNIVRDDYIRDFQTIKKMIDNTNNNVIISLPQNDKNNSGLKNNIDAIYESLKYLLSLDYGLIFGTTSSKLDNLTATSDFIFENVEEYEIMTKSINGNKASTIKSNHLLLTTIKIENYSCLEEFLIETKLKKVISESSPEWMNEIKMFDDDEQFEIIKSKEQEITELMEKISDAESILKENDKFKSILYTQSDELVEVVFEIFQELLDINLSEFVDKKIEDISFEVDGKIFVGEVKGITSNVKTPNLSQLDNHYTLYMEEHSSYKEEDVFRLLIINHQRKKPILDREPIHESQIKFAKEKYKILIIETTELLKLLEQYRSNTITRVDIIEMFTSVGVLKI